MLVVPAGERWPDGSLRPALEDGLGAGALIQALGLPALPEAQAAARSFAGTPDLPGALHGCSSGRKLLERGFGTDLALATEVNVSGAVPELRDGAYLPAE